MTAERPTDGGAPPEVFISYSRADAAFVERLGSLLEDDGLGVWVDIEGLYAGEEFWPEVTKAIDAATVVVFVMTPDSAASRFCRQELEHAGAGGKRIVPVCHREVDVDSLHPALTRLQWVFFRERDDPAAARAALLSAVRADWVRLRQQARLLVHAREWDRRGRDASLLLRGRDLREAERWLVENRGTDGATALHDEYIRASRTGARRRLAQAAGLAAAAVTLIVAVAFYAAAQRVASLNNLSLDDLNRQQPAAAIEKLERATALCARFRSLFSGCADAELNLGRANLDAGRFQDAADQFSRIIDRTVRQDSQDSDDPGFLATAYQNRAFAGIMTAELHRDDGSRLDAYRRAGEDLDAATGWFEQTAEGASGRPLSITRARIRIGRGEYAGARADLERAALVSPALDIDLLLSLVHHCEGDGARSLEHFKRYMGELPGRLQDPHWRLNRDYYSRIRERCRGVAQR